MLELGRFTDRYRQADEAWAGWADSELDWKLAEQMGPEGDGQWHKV